MNNLVLKIGLLIAISIFSSLDLRAQTMEDLYQMANKAYYNGGSSEKAVAGYFIMVGEVHRNNLRYLEKTGKASDAEIEIRKRLDEALQPLSRLNNSWGGAAVEKGDSNKRSLSDQYPTMAREVFKIIGPRKATEIVQQQIVASVTSRIRQEQLNAHGPVCLFTDKRFAEVIGLSEKQCEQINRMTQTTTETFRAGPGKEFSDLENLYRQHWTELRRELDPEQKKKAERLIGEPVQWFRALRSVRYRDPYGNRPRLTRIDRRTLTLAKRLGKKQTELTYDDLKQDGLSVYHLHFCQMLQMNFVWDELQLSMSQRKKLHNDFAQGKLKDSIIIAGTSQVRLQEILADDSDLPEYTVDVFTKFQQQWLKHFEFQLLTEGHRSTFGLLEPIVAESLELSNAQRSRIKPMAEQFEKQHAELETSLTDQRQEIMNEFTKGIARILTDKQHELYVQYTGQSLELNEE